MGCFGSGRKRVTVKCILNEKIITGFTVKVHETDDLEKLIGLVRKGLFRYGISAVLYEVVDHKRRQLPSEGSVMQPILDGKRVVYACLAPHERKLLVVGGNSAPNTATVVTIEEPPFTYDHYDPFYDPLFGPPYGYRGGYGYGYGYGYRGYGYGPRYGYW